MFLEAEASLEYLGLEAPRQRQSWGLPLALGAEYKYGSLISVVWWFEWGRNKQKIATQFSKSL